MKVGLTMQGASDLEKRLRSLPDGVSKRVQIEALTQGAEPIRAKAQSLAPRSDSAPHMADSITIQPASRRMLDDAGMHDVDAAVAIGPTRNFFYGFFQEVGTAFHGAQPFMRPAFDSESRRSLNIVASELWTAIRRHLSLGGRSTAGRNL